MTGVVFVADSERIGGGNRAVTDIAAGLDRTRFSPVLLVPRPGPLVEWATSLHIPVRIMPAGRSQGGRLEFLCQAGAITAAVLRSRAKIIHASAHTCYRAVGLAGFLTGAARICHLGFPPQPKEIEYVFRFGPEVVIGCYRGQASEVSDMVFRVSPRSRITAIPYGIDTTKYSPQVDGMPIASDLRFGAKHVALIVGHLSEVKGYPAFFKAAARVARLVDSVAFLVLGEETVKTGYREYLEELARSLGIAHCVYFLGWRADVATVLRAADVMVLPSRAEGLPLSILEAMACGKPVVATRVNGVPEAVVDGTTGTLVEPDDDEAIAEALLRLFHKPDIARRMGAEARQVAETQFSVTRFVRDIETLYDELTTATSWRRSLQGRIRG
jgi:glycosyltransferase involved in cell wall biosynthesis